jgi:hypothetical protein
MKRGPGKRMVDSKDFHLADEVRHIQRCAARYDGRIVTVGQLILFSTQTGDAWLLDKQDGLATQLARDGDPEPIHIEETDANFSIEGKGRYRIQGRHSCTLTAKRAGDRLNTSRLLANSLLEPPMFPEPSLLWI